MITGHDKKKKIQSIIVNGEKILFNERHEVYEWFTVSGEMALIDWIRVYRTDGTFIEYNTKCISQINYLNEEK